jgi:hypothetical protein
LPMWHATDAATQAPSREILIVPLPTAPFTWLEPLTCGTHMLESSSTSSTSMAAHLLLSHALPTTDGLLPWSAALTPWPARPPMITAPSAVPLAAAT